MLFSRVAADDPLGLYPSIVERASNLQTEAGDDRAGVVFLRARPSAFDSARQEKLLRDIQEAFSRVEQQLGTELVLQQSGVNRFAVASERSIRRDMNFISGVSLAGVGILFVLVFRSLRSLLIAILPAAIGISAAAALAATAFRPVHGATLGFGLALIGVAIDYPIHLLNHHALGPPSTPRATAARVRRSLVMGGATTALSFGILTLSEFPGVDDMGVFAGFGVLVALAVTLLCLPAFLPQDGRALSTRFQRSAAASLGRFVRQLRGSRAGAATIPTLFIAITLLGLPQVRWQDDPASLTIPDPELSEENRRVQAAVSGMDTGRLVIGLAPSRQEALELNDRIFERLRTAVASGHLEATRSAHALLWSEELQRRNLAAFRGVPDLDARIDAAFAEAGFRSGAFAPFGADVRSPNAPPLRPEDLADGPLGPILAASLVPLDDGWAAITYLKQVGSPEGIRASLTGLEGAHYFDQHAVLEEIYAGYRRSTLRLVAVGSMLVLAVLLIRYRRPREALLAFLPSALVALTTLGLFGLFQVPVNLLGVVSLLLVMGMGVDYGVFMLESARDPERLDPTILGLLVSCLTTVLVFGTLALSEQPALRSIGLTTGIGVFLAFLVSPAILALSDDRSR
jgi:predicted exporter